VKGIRIYVEGGGDSRDGKRAVRQAFSGFLRDLRDLAQSKRVEWDIIACGGRGRAYDRFVQAQGDHPDALCILLVDSEGPVNAAARAHLRSREPWECLGDDDAYHLMVQAMEAWLIADLEALSEYYGQGFRRGSLPRRRDVEAIPKDQLEPKLRAASHATQKGEHHKIRHAAPLLERLDPAKVRTRASHCDRLFRTLESKLAELTTPLR